MQFGQMRHRITLMKKNGTVLNSMNEKVPSFELFHPGLDILIVYEDKDEDGAMIFRSVEDDKTVEIDTTYAYWAYVRPTTGREYEEAQKIRAETTYSVTMRFLPGVTYDMFVIHHGKKLKIESILDVDERHKELTLVCSEVVR